ncbi:IS110 family transposase [Alteromonas sp. MmMcT2-2]|uniref:IS110 family transposase n=1 Tax=Alteromonas sp. MmMcT2-2 TaxID=2917732 RepID=UPI001EF2E7A8|nr:IS110 family transposase [Alteromonas sp. MmMcT2-2]MCG7642297.1 IS110 family transposase [Alteromonas sp. MmMcT2-2]
MNFYTNTHPYYCGIDLHTRLLYVCIIDNENNILVHEKIDDSPDKLLALLKPYLGNIVVGVECMHCWYWVSDFCEEHNIDFILGHALYMKAIHAGKTKNDKIDALKIAKLMRGGNFPLAHAYSKKHRSIRDALRRRTHIMRMSAQLKAHVASTVGQYNLPALETRLDLRNSPDREKMRHFFPDEAVQKSMDLNLNIIETMVSELYKIEHYVKTQAQTHCATDLHILKSFPGIGKILALTILYEVGDIKRFPSVQKFASYSRLVKCKAESAGKTHGTQGNKIGNAHLKWAFSEAAVLYLKGNDNAKRYLAKLQKRMSKAKALSALAHKIGRCTYFMLKNQQVFDEERFLNG